MQKFVSEFVEEALDTSVLPGFARLDEAGLDACGEFKCPELWAVVAYKASRLAVDEEESRKLFLHRKRMGTSAPREGCKICRTLAVSRRAG